MCKLLVSLSSRARSPHCIQACSNLYVICFLIFGVRAAIVRLKPQRQGLNASEGLGPQAGERPGPGARSVDARRLGGRRRRDSRDHPCTLTTTTITLSIASVYFPSHLHSRVIIGNARYYTRKRFSFPHDVRQTCLDTRLVENDAV